jgi:CPA1 family monovalent cation:H+ antiporter
MNIFTILAIFITLAALAAYLNYRYIKLPSAIGMMLIGLIISLIMIILNSLGMGFKEPMEDFLTGIDFGEALMKGMLSFLLFAGALKINLDDLAKRKFIIGTLASAGVIATTFIVGTVLYFILKIFGLYLPYVYCLIFGALIAPTDPVAVMSILRQAGASPSLETKIAGESLFNDGVGVVIFTAIVGIAYGGGESPAGQIVLLFIREALGGAVFGVAAGYIAYRMLKNVNDHVVEIIITLALVSGGYTLASYLHLSGPIAIVIAGLLIGNHGRSFAMSKSSCERLDDFWELIDEILNAVLFVWIGMEILVLTFNLAYLAAGLIAIPVVLAARLFSVWSSVTLLKKRREFSENAIKILTWGGLRGGISIAMALSLAIGWQRDIIVSMTYVVVLFSILVQGLTIKKLFTGNGKKSP